MEGKLNDLKRWCNNHSKEESKATLILQNISNFIIHGLKSITGDKIEEEKAALYRNAITKAPKNLKQTVNKISNVVPNKGGGRGL